MAGKRTVLLSVGVAALTILGALPASAGSSRTVLVSITSAGDPAAGESRNASISASGRFVAFHSDATNLPGDDSATDVYVHDRQTGKTQLVSKTSAGDPATGGGGSFDVSISDSGRLVAFLSGATNLPGDDSVTDVYVYDRETAKTKLVSKTSADDPADGDCEVPSISGSGRFVAFESSADNLPGDDSLDDIYVHDRQTGKTKLVSKTSAGDPAANGHSLEPSISDSGRFVAFQSTATNLPGGDATEIYVHDRQTGETQLVSKTSAGDPADGNSHRASISGSGRFAAFDSQATNLPGDDSVFDVYVHGPLR